MMMDTLIQRRGAGQRGGQRAEAGGPERPYLIGMAGSLLFVARKRCTSLVKKVHGKVSGDAAATRLFSHSLVPESPFPLRHLRTKFLFLFALHIQIPGLFLRTACPSPHIMFGAVRRCPATLSRSLAAISTRTLRTPLTYTPGLLRIPLQSSRLANAAISGFHHSAKWQQAVAQEAEQSAPQHELITEFKDLATRGLVHPNLINTITKQMRLKTMTDVQSRTINEALSGVDV